MTSRAKSAVETISWTAPPTADPPVKWGILGTARICRRWVPALKTAPSAKLVAVASRNERSAKERADSWGCRAVASYQALIDDPEIEAVYIPLPNGLHAEWVSRALRAGKAVACEKSLVATQEDLDTIATAVEETEGWLAETFQYRHHPLFDAALKIVQSDLLGELIRGDATFTFTLDDPKNIRWDKDLGGGALFDLGCYVIGVQRHLFDVEPTNARAVAVWREGPTGFVDESMRGELTFGKNSAGQPIKGGFRFSYADKWSCGWQITGSAGTLICDHDFAWNLQQHHGGQHLRIDFAHPQKNIAEEGLASRIIKTYEADKEYDSYELMVEDFSSAIRFGKKPRWDFADSASLLRTLLNVMAAAKGE